MYHISLSAVAIYLGVLAIVAEASPTNIVRTHQRSHIIPRVKDENFDGYDGPTELLKAYRKHNMPVSQALSDSSNTRYERTAHMNKKRSSRSKEAGSVPAKPQQNGVKYVSPVSIGGQTINLDFDTGSADLWVFGPGLGAHTLVEHEIYDANKSDTATPLLNSTFNCLYADGSGVYGPVVKDDVDIGGVTVRQQAVGIATAVAQKYGDDTTSNGLLGLASSALNTVQPERQSTFFENIMPDLEEPVFTADLRKTDAGTYEFGRIDDSKYEGNLAWVPIDGESGHWQFTSDAFGVGDAEMQTSEPGLQAIADTGTTLIVAHPATVVAYYEQVDGAVNDTQYGGFVFPCETELPDLNLDIGGVYTARVPGDDIKFLQYSDEICFGGLQETPIDVQIFGDIFFRSQFVAFHGGNQSIGVAQHAARDVPSPDRKPENPMADLGRPRHGKH